jgi:hypothetical protein
VTQNFDRQYIWKELLKEYHRLTSPKWNRHKSTPSLRRSAELFGRAEYKSTEKPPYSAKRRCEFLYKGFLPAGLIMLRFVRSDVLLISVNSKEYLDIRKIWKVIDWACR